MKQSTLHHHASPARMDGHGLHVGIVMDGNGRWAIARGMPRRRGHEAGANAVTRIVQAAVERSISTLTLYAFSADNWKRPRREVQTLLALFRRYLEAECERCRTQNIRLSVIGRRDRLPRALVAVIERVEEATRPGPVMHLRIAIDYSARDAILDAVASAAGAQLTRNEFAELLGACQHGGPALDVDLLIRTGGERRLSDFLLWECAYAELWFSARAWPEFDATDLDAALTDFAHRERRFGGLAAVPAAAC